MEVDFHLDEGGAVRLTRAGDQPPNLALDEAIERLRGSATTSMTTDELMALTRG